MAVLEILSALALRPLVEGLTDASRGAPPDQLARLFRGWLTDQSQRLPRALASAHRRAWQALAVGATGLRGFFSFLQGASKLLEPGPDALSFLQTMSGQIAARQHSPAAPGCLPAP